MRLIVLVTTLLLTATALALYADEQTHAGKAEFQIPDGWMQLQNTKNVVLVPDDLPKGRTSYIAVLTPRTLEKTTLSQWFDEEWKQLQKGYTIVEGGEPQTQFAKAGYETVFAVAKVRNEQNKISLVWLMGAHVNDRVERFLFLCDQDVDIERYQKGLAAFVASLSFEDLQTQEQ